MNVTDFSSIPGRMHRADKIALLQRSGLLASLSPAEFDALLPSCREIVLRSRQHLCHEGEEGSTMYVVLAGKLAVIKTGKQVAIGSSGDCFGEMALIEKRERSATLQALDNALILEIPETAFREHLSTNPAVLMALLKIFSERSRDDLGKLVSANLQLQAQAELMDRQNQELHTIRAQLEQRNSELQRLTELDTLTHIANRRRFDAVLHWEWRRAVQHQSPFSLIFCDIDHFKLFNDTYGHQAGDACLVRVAQTMEETLKRPADLVARYGGEEFIALLADTDADGARLLAEKMRARIEALRIENCGSPVSAHVTATLGAATLVPRVGIQPEDLVALADRALYAAKAKGRNRVLSADQLPNTALLSEPEPR